MKKKKVIVICILVGILWGCISNSTAYLEWRITCTKQIIKSTVFQDNTNYQELALMIMEEAQTENEQLYFSKEHYNFPEALYQNTIDMLGCGVYFFDEIYIGGHTSNIYPEGSCVFRRTVNYHRGVYAWVDLVFIPQSKENQAWYKSMAMGSEQITDEWYLVILYGF